MLTFSVNREVDLSGINFTAKTWYGREWLGETYMRAVGGSLGAAPVIPSMDKWGFGCTQKTNLSKMRREVEIISENDLEDGQKGVVLERADETLNPNLVTYDKEALAFEEEEYYQQQLEQFASMRELIFLEHQVDFALLLLQAANYVRAAQEKIRFLNSQYLRLDTLVADILTGSTWHEDLQRMTNQPLVCLG